MAAAPIALLSDADFDLTVEEPIFEALAATELGIAGSDEDGFPALLAEAQLSTNDEPNVMAGLDSEELAITGEMPEVQTEHETPIALDMADAQAAGNQAVLNYERGIGATP